MIVSKLTRKKPTAFREGIIMSVKYEKTGIKPAVKSELSLKNWTRNNIMSIFISIQEKIEVLRVIPPQILVKPKRIENFNTHS